MFVDHFITALHYLVEVYDFESLKINLQAALHIDEIRAALFFMGI